MTLAKTRGAELKAGWDPAMDWWPVQAVPLPFTQGELEQAPADPADDMQLVDETEEDAEDRVRWKQLIHHADP